MPRGPLPDPQKRRRNAPTIASTALPAAGRKGKAPAVPKAYKLGPAGKAWWAWAWKLPQATAWNDGDLYALARRAQLEDMRVALGEGESIDLAELLGMGDAAEAAKTLQWLIRTLKQAAGGVVGVMKEMRELDNRFGLNPKGLADLRWTIAHDEDAPAQPVQSTGKKQPKASSTDRRRRLHAVK